MKITFILNLSELLIKVRFERFILFWDRITIKIYPYLLRIMMFLDGYLNWKIWLTNRLAQEFAKMEKHVALP